MLATIARAQFLIYYRVKGHNWYPVDLPKLTYTQRDLLAAPLHLEIAAASLFNNKTPRLGGLTIKIC